jgi:hypothetical protein
MRASAITALVTAGLFAVSIWVVLKGARDEPYMAFHASDAVVQIGVASALMALWVVWIGFITTLVIQTKLHRGWLSIWVIFAAALLGLYDCPAGYISDLVSFHVVVR